MALSKEAEDTMKTLGHDIKNVEGGDVDESAAGSDQQVEASGSDQVAKESGSDQVVENLGSDQVVKKEEEQPKDEKTWQSWYDQSQLDLKERDTALVKSEAEKEALMKLLGGQQQVQPKVEPKKEDSEPQLSEFIKLDDYYVDDALNPGTASGLAYQKFNRATIVFEQKKALKEYDSDKAEQASNEMAQKQADALCEAYSEFKNPLTGQPDMGKITNFITSLSNSDNVNLWAELYQFTKGKNNKNQPSQVNVGKRADSVSPVGSLPATETEKKPLPEAAKGMAVFGNDFEIPAGVEIE